MAIRMPPWKVHTLTEGYTHRLLATDFCKSLVYNPCNRIDRWPHPAYMHRCSSVHPSDDPLQTSAPPSRHLTPFIHRHQRPLDSTAPPKGDEEKDNPATKSRSHTDLLALILYGEYKRACMHGLDTPRHAPARLAPHSPFPPHNFQRHHPFATPPPLPTLSHSFPLHAQTRTVHARTHARTHTHTHTHSPTHLPIHPLTHSLTHSLTHTRAHVHPTTYREVSPWSS